jgi:hypothetical protein
VGFFCFRASFFFSAIAITFSNYLNN